MKKLILSLFLATFLLWGCKTIEIVREVPVEVVKYVQRSDTFVLNTKDSVYIRQKGDTVYSEKFRTVYRDRVRVQRDSVPYIVEITKTEIKEVEKQVKVRDWIWWIGSIGLIYAFIRIVLFIRKKVLHLP